MASSLPTATPHERAPVSVITGCPGSGKTTLLNRLLADTRLPRAAVIINKFGSGSITCWWRRPPGKPSRQARGRSWITCNIGDAVVK